MFELRVVGRREQMMPHEVRLPGIVRAAPGR